MNVDMPHPSDAWPKDAPDDEKIAGVWYEMQLNRSKELSMVIDDMEEEMFMSNRLHFGKAKLDFDKLIGAGHSLGGATIIEAGNNEDRIKMVLSLDPHGNSLKNTIGNYSALHEKYVQIQNTE